MMIVRSSSILSKYDVGHFLVFGYFAARKINAVWTGLDLKSKSSAKYFSGPIQTNIWRVLKVAPI